MKLREVLLGVEAQIPAAVADLEIRQVACDSRKVRPRALFFALHGAKADGNAFIRDAVGRGAAGIVSEEAAPAMIPPSVAWIRVREARKALAVASANSGTTYNEATFTAPGLTVTASGKQMSAALDQPLHKLSDKIERERPEKGVIPPSRKRARRSAK
jgi:UDP-N-acetylmuramoyl-L-alanyl-D-glutamate--2,6-diaminopimelate ligase